MTCVISLDSPTDSATARPAPDPSQVVITLARNAALDEADIPASVGDFAGAFVEDDAAVTVTFAAELRGYSGWLWSVVLGRADTEGSADIATASWTVSEVVLLPGSDALLAPTWVPWDRRVEQGDLGVGDLLRTELDDDRLVPAYVLSDDPEIERTALELGWGRVRVLSRDGRTDVADRWHDSAFGPGDPMAVAAPGRCGQCGFFLPLAGSLGGMFGVCANEMAPGDSRVVDVEYGCGAHSEAVAPLLVAEPATDVVIDELQMDVHPREFGDGEDTVAVENTGEDTVAVDDAVAAPVQDVVVDVTVVDDAVVGMAVQQDRSQDENIALAAVLELLPAAVRPELTAGDTHTADTHTADTHRADVHRADVHRADAAPTTEV